MVEVPTLERLATDLSSTFAGANDSGAGVIRSLGGRNGAGEEWRSSPTLRLFEEMPVGLAIYDRGGSLAHANPHFGRMVACPDFPARANRDAGLWAAWSDEGRALGSGDFPWERAMRGEVVSPGINMRHSGQDGGDRWLTVSASPIVDPAHARQLGVVLLYVEAGTDKRPAPVSTGTGWLFGQFAEASGSAVWTADLATGIFGHGNARHLALRGDDGAAGLADWLELVTEGDRDRVRCCHDMARAGAIGHVEYGVAGARRLRETCFPIRDDHGRVTMLAGIAEDVTPCLRRPVYHVGDGCHEGASPAGPAKRFDDIAALLDMADFLSPGCVVIDVASCPDAETGLAGALARLPDTLPVIVVGRPDTHAATAVAAMRAGAVDYLIPPILNDTLAAALARAGTRIVAPVTADRAAVPVADDSADRLRCLSKREREVLAGLVAGGTNKLIARDLGISPRTVELHRAHLMERMNVPNLAALLRIAQRSGM